MNMREQRDAISEGIASVANDAVDKSARAVNRAADLSGQAASSLKGIGVDTDKMAAVAARQAGAVEAALIEMIFARGRYALWR